MTCFVGLPVGDYACAGVGDGDVGSGNGRLAGIGDSPLNSAAKFLCKCIGGEQGCGQEQNAFQSHGDLPGFFGIRDDLGILRRHATPVMGAIISPLARKKQDNWTIGRNYLG